VSRRTDPTWERWSEVDQLLEVALELDPAEREHMLSTRERFDPDLVEAVRSLLVGSALADERLTGLGASLFRSALEEVPADGFDTLGPGQSVGRYRIVERLGRGGMATVYLAERSDGAFEQQVALKVLRRGLDTEEVVRRFVAERRILSGLSHPNIARLLDGGATDDGRPFLVVETVEGEAITEWADHRRANVRERLTLFLQVAEAVRFAHSHLVVHRDIKPSNVLVGQDGQVKLLDFGIAKLLAPEAQDDALTRTGTPLPLTPDYASPEQLLGESVTTASDVFQLGVLLYVLLTGRTPFSRVGTAWAPMRAATDPAPPSEVVARSGQGGRKLELGRRRDTADAEGAGVAEDRGTTREALRRRLKGDLDVIVLKALRREPERRYASVEQLAEDVRRHLDGRPVLARPARVSYRANRFIRRHPAGVTFGVAVTGLVGAFAIVSAAQTRRIAAERDRVQIEAAKTAQVRDFLTGIFTLSDPDRAKGERITARELLDSGATRVRRELASQPELEAEMLTTIGRVYARLGLYEPARALLEDARGVYESSLTQAAIPGYVETLHQLSTVVGRTDADRAQELLARAIELAAAERGSESAAVAELLTELAQRTTRGQEYKDSITDRAVGILRRAPGEYRAQLAKALAIGAYGRASEEAVSMQREALTIRRGLYGDLHSEVAASLSDLALTLQDTDPMASDSLLSEALDIDRRLLGERHSITMTVMNNLAGIRRDMGDYARAEPMYREVLRLRREVYPDEWVQAYPLHGLGWVLTEEGKAEEAEGYLRESLRVLEGRFQQDRPLIQIARSTLGRCLARQGRYEEAEPLLVGAWEATEGKVGPRVESLLRRRLVEFYEDWGRPEDAQRFAKSRTDAGGGAP